MAPQPAVDVPPAPDSQDRQDQSQAPDRTRNSKQKKPQDLPALLEVLLERLCIWHSLDSSSPANK
ncbi:hypothetical protein LTR53_019516, partial [Teratosphaeriaceae sp. CCFEE 6253]